MTLAAGRYPTLPDIILCQSQFQVWVAARERRPVHSRAAFLACHILTEASLLLFYSVHIFPTLLQRIEPTHRVPPSASPLTHPRLLFSHFKQWFTRACLSRQSRPCSCIYSISATANRHARPGTENHHMRRRRRAGAAPAQLTKGPTATTTTTPHASPHQIRRCLHLPHRYTRPLLLLIPTILRSLRHHRYVRPSPPTTLHPPLQPTTNPSPFLGCCPPQA